MHERQNRTDEALRYAIGEQLRRTFEAGGIIGSVLIAAVTNNEFSKGNTGIAVTEFVLVELWVLAAGLSFYKRLRSSQFSP